MQRFLEQTIAAVQNNPRKDIAFLTICEESIQYYNEGKITSTQLGNILAQFIQYDELFKKKDLLRIVSIASILENPQTIALKYQTDLIQELIKTVKIAKLLLQRI